MKRISILISALFLFVGASLAQSSYKVHTIKEGETLSQLAKKYGTSVGDIMRLNKMTTSSKLSIGEEVKIPTKHADASSEAAMDIPDTHTVVKGETLYQISHKYQIPVTDLRDWNNITGNTIQVGQVLKLKKMAAVDNLVANTSDQNSDTTNQLPPNNATQTAENTPITNTNQEEKQRNNEEKPSNASVFDQTSVKPAVTDEGLYATTYKSQASGTELITKGSSGVFKTASGWQDKKYFILMNDVNPGTVVKVQANGKTIYAKILWNLGNVKENEGLSYRISDAAANVLGVSGDKFDLIVSYFK
ncbi:LysM peptidoglycan-binding domain-containing protein [Arachidicoccus sp.]|uniref:LysM peptidoglycan-binding domain-containing protein n=1 Tax=Arachidicoccus sp. TaxID=1872624 RepID=UPI003D22FC4C